MIWRKLNNQTRSHKLVRNKVSCSGKLGARRNRCRGRLCWFWRLCSATLRSKLFLLGRSRFRRSSLRHLLRLVNYTPHRLPLQHQFVLGVAAAVVGLQPHHQVAVVAPQSSTHLGPSLCLPNPSLWLHLLHFAAQRRG